MKYLNKYNMKLITEARWAEAAILRGKYERNDEIKEFFLTLIDLGGVFRSTNTIYDEDFVIKQRINYVDKPIYEGYVVGVRLDDLYSNFDKGNTDYKMDKSIEFFNEFTDILMNLKDFGFKFKLFNMDGDGVFSKFSMMIYHPEDAIPWEHIFAYKEGFPN